ncbi:radical SAM family heme chaperone HemW [Psychroflexus montanilacus]|uniref:radical SAM family heme chaperone HemW n=1 Tax=Psychroflexus montanilacus TaxID=2873598 RepID=UPI001CCEFC32|nr:radical SAM family heme chaperone HemW [Psychroflexus montanilacus]MBZ9651414.1 radical SAM family heme chaperone HemW [Psychroflexus montanilacus]
MSSLYIHIPFCKQACHYCDFHFSTSLKHKGQLVQAICKELSMRKDELPAAVENIYFGGGTPSLLSETDLNLIFKTIYSEYKVVNKPEITLEANPDDLDFDYLKMLSGTKVNRLSIGVQSFFEEDLKLMNRAHNAKEAESSILLAKQFFDNISIDLIYGIPDMCVDRWKANLAKTLELDIPHISSYALTVEPNTALKHFIDKEIIPPVDDDLAKLHFDILVETMQSNNFENYEFSNFGKPGYFSQNNTAYWTGKFYLGIGPSAHSFVNTTRSWNINNNSKYIKAIDAGELPAEREELTTTDRYNEYIMTRLRTKWGVDLKVVETEFGLNYAAYLMEHIQEFQQQGLLALDKDILRVTGEGKFLSDGIASELFMLNLK